jgi:NAD(P)-dependent dehydrogenase (short-subunit alcohol dehydrogenase family)
MDFSLSRKTAFVSGGSRGIGRTVAKALGQAGAPIAIDCHRHRANKTFCAVAASTADRDLHIVNDSAEDKNHGARYFQKCSTDSNAKRFITRHNSLTALAASIRGHCSKDAKNAMAGRW